MRITWLVFAVLSRVIETRIDKARQNRATRLKAMSCALSWHGIYARRNTIILHNLAGKVLLARFMTSDAFRMHKQ
jgi:hypothetical protein